MANYRCTRRRMKIKRARATAPALGGSPPHTPDLPDSLVCVCVGVGYFRVADAAKSVVAIENAGMNRAMARQADAEREKRAKI